MNATEKSVFLEVKELASAADRNRSGVMRVRQLCKKVFLMSREKRGRLSGRVRESVIGRIAAGCGVARQGIGRFCWSRKGGSCWGRRDDKTGARIGRFF